MKKVRNEVMPHTEMPLFFYRSPDAIREDISKIRDRIGEVKRAFSIREMLLGMISDGKDRGPKELLYDLEALLSEAEAAYMKLSELREELTFLEEELSLVKCKIKM